MINNLTELFYKLYDSLKLLGNFYHPTKWTNLQTKMDQQNGPTCKPKWPTLVLIYSDLQRNC